MIKPKGKRKDYSGFILHATAAAAMLSTRTPAAVCILIGGCELVSAIIRNRPLTIVLLGFGIESELCSVLGEDGKENPDGNVRTDGSGVASDLMPILMLVSDASVLA